jgi:hypothetical protein
MGEDLKRVHGFSDLQTFFPTLSRIYRLSKHDSTNVWFDNAWQVAAVDISGTSGPCRVKVLSADSSESWKAAFLKVTHLLDPVRWMKGSYSIPRHTGLPWHSKTWVTANNKIQNPNNQAYVEAMASYALGRLREEGVSPHFNEFYGAFCARADIYRYNLTDEYGSFKTARWFWNGQKKGLYSLCVVDVKNPAAPVMQDLVDEILKEPSVMDEESDRAPSEEEILVEGGDTNEKIELESLHSDHFSDVSFATEEEESEESEESEENSEDEDDDDDDEEEEEDYRIYATFRDFPVMIVAVEENRGTMDSLMDSEEAVGVAAGTSEWETRWSAWLFQVVAALSCAQSLLGFTHNDLHTNNVVWTETSEPYFWYKSRAGGIFKVPTFGKLFRIIDFGRSIFSINGKMFISDDFCKGNDAEGQYCFKPLHPRPAPEELVPPNPSFDLSRLAVSLIDGVFPDAPSEKKGGAVLSSEEGLVVKETVSPLYNLLWSWMVDDSGENILIEADGEEKFPDFGLYRHIAAHVHSAVPAQQFSKPAFDQFQVAEKDMPTGQRIWHLFA